MARRFWAETRLAEEAEKGWRAFSRFIPSPFRQRSVSIQAALCLSLPVISIINYEPKRW